MEANIPLNKIAHPSVVQFLEKYTEDSVPSESTLRNKYVDILCNEVMQNLRRKAASKKIWVSLDETCMGCIELPIT